MINNKYIVEICGASGVGKSTFADQLTAKIELSGNMEVERIAFADHIYQFLLERTNFSGSLSFFKSYVKKYNLDYDEVLSGIPVKVLLTLIADVAKWATGNDNFFVDVVRQKINDSSADIIVIDDLRYDYEAELCDFIIMVAGAKADVGALASHSSEKGVSVAPDFVLDRNKTPVNDAINTVHKAILNDGVSKLLNELLFASQD